MTDQDVVAAPKNYTLAEMRVQIALDVIARIVNEQFTPVCGTVGAVTAVATWSSDALYRSNKTLQELLSTNLAVCRVCAFGGLFYALKLRVHPEANVQQYPWLVDSTTLPDLLQYFSTAQLALIETAFEGRIVCKGLQQQGSEDLHLRVSTEYARGEPKQRLMRIMRNIVDNDGTFVP